MTRRPKPFDQADVVPSRKASGLNQSEYWNRFGVTQSGGSRYESGRAIPTPTKMLIWLAQTGRLAEADLKDALAAVKRR